MFEMIIAFVIIPMSIIIIPVFFGITSGIPYILQTKKRYDNDYYTEDTAPVTHDQKF